jgi:predicted Zn-dependent protease
MLFVERYSGAGKRMMHFRKEFYKNLANVFEISYQRFQVEQRPIARKNIVLMETDERVDEAILAYSLGDEEKAEGLLIESLKENPSSVDALRALAEVYLSRQKVEPAEATCRRALAIEPEDLASVVSLARILVRKGDKEGAEEATARARVLGWKEELAEGDSTD